VELLTQARDGVPHRNGLAAPSCDDGHTAVLAHGSFSVLSLEGPAHGDHVVSAEAKEVPDADLLGLE